MQKILHTVLSLLLFSSIAIAEKSEGKKFEDHKNHVLQNIEKRNTYLSEFKTCVNAATAHEQIKKCRQDHKDKNKSLRDENHEMKHKNKK